MGLRHFLLVFDLDKQELVSQDAFDDGEEAATAYTALEREYRDRSDLEIVLVGADDIDTVRLTHGHYFNRGAASPYLTG